MWTEDSHVELVDDAAVLEHLEEEGVVRRGAPLGDDIRRARPLLPLLLRWRRGRFLHLGVAGGGPAGVRRIPR
jgi:hypothetical protein